MGKLNSDTTAATAIVNYAEEWLTVPELLLDQVRRDPDAVEQHFRALDAVHEYRAHSLVNVDALALLVVDPAAQRLLFSSGSLPPEPLGLIDWDMAERADDAIGPRDRAGGPSSPGLCSRL